jgi:Fe-S cluster biogenesis protein NfuA
MPKISDIEDTPNPNALKFILKEPLTWGITHSYDNALQAQDDELATALFNIEHVTNVFYVDRWLTVTQDGEAYWPELMRLVAVPIRAAPAAKEKSTVTVAAAASAIADLSPEDQERINKISALLDSQIRPHLQRDGGDLVVISLKDNILTVHYQGACGTCPSSIAGTLRSIANMVRTIEPDIEIVTV